MVYHIHYFSNELMVEKYLTKGKNTINILVVKYGCLVCLGRVGGLCQRVQLIFIWIKIVAALFSKVDRDKKGYL